MTQKTSTRKKVAHRKQRDLDIEIGFMEGIVKRDPQYIEALQILGDDYTRRGKYVAGLKIDEQLAQLRPADSLVQYNLACSCSLTEQFERAVGALEKALSLGYRDFKWLAKDPDLEKLRDHPLYARIQAKVRRLGAKQA